VCVWQRAREMYMTVMTRLLFVVTTTIIKNTGILEDSEIFACLSVWFGHMIPGLYEVIEYTLTHWRTPGIHTSYFLQKLSSC